MLHRTHHPFYFPSAVSTTTTTSSFPVQKEMECPEMMVDFGSKQVTTDDFCNFNTQNAAPVSVSGEDFFVDQLLNINDQEEGKEDESGFLVVVKEEPLDQTEPPNTNKVSAFLSPSLETDRNTDDFGSVLSVPAEEADLEWLSHFVEESFSQFSTPYPTGIKPLSEQPNPNPGPESETRKAPFFGPPPSKSRRSKRARTGGRVWSTALGDTSSPSSSPPSSPEAGPAPSRKQRKREGGPPRRCSHCGVQKTPQWRTGPLGAKTLCNACGVRFKSGRLLPEYRPACSPTFSSELHSNNHRKVLEMRRKKEMVITGPPEPRLAHPVTSFG